jgi:NTE family protein
VSGAILVLSGGGAKTAAHCGAVRALHERGIEPVRYVATSLGAVVAVALASGAEPDTVVRALMNEAASGVRPHPLAALAGIHLEGLVRARPFRRALGRMLPARSFGELKVPVTVTAVDVDRLEMVTFGYGGIDAPLLDVLAASCALPPYFPPVVIDGRPLRDGGLVGHLPLAAVGETGGMPVIAVDVGPGLDNGREPRQPGGGPALIRAIDESLGILMAQVTVEQVARWRQERGTLLYVRPRVERNATFSTSRARVYADEGYLAMRDALGGFDSLVQPTRLP